MKELKKDIEQLEQVAQQLEKGTSTGARIALLLLIAETKDINEDEGETIKSGHYLRNEAYHDGVLRESIIRQITMTYFEVACKLLPCLWIRAYSYSSEAEVKSFLREFGIQEGMISTENLSIICDQLVQGKTCPIEKLSSALSEYLVERLDNTVDHLNYLASNSMRKETPDDILKRIQFVQVLEALDFPKTDEGFQQYIEAQNALWPKYKPSITLRRFARWKERASLLTKEKLPGSALKKFLNMDKELLPIERNIEDAVFKFEEMIDAMIHDR